MQILSPSGLPLDLHELKCVKILPSGSTSQVATVQVDMDETGNRISLWYGQSMAQHTLREQQMSELTKIFRS